MPPAFPAAEIYIEDYSDLETQVEAIAHVDLIEQDLLDKPRDQVIVHMYLAPDEPPAEVLALLKDRLDSCEMPLHPEHRGAWSSRIGRLPGSSTTTPWTLASACHCAQLGGV